MPKPPTIITCSSANTTLHTWHVNEGQPRIALNNVNLVSVHALVPVACGVFMLHNAPSGTCLLYVSRSGAVVRTVLPDPFGRCIAVSDVFFAVGTSRGKVRIWTASGTLVAEFQAHWKGVECMTFSDDGEVLISGGVDGLVKVFCVADCVAVGREAAECRVVLEGHTLPVCCVDVGYGGTNGRVVTGGMDGWVKVWHMGSKRCLGSWLVGGQVKALKLGLVERSLFVGCSDGHVKVVEVGDVVEGGVQGKIVTLKSGEGGAVSAMAVGGGYLVVGYEQGVVNVFDDASGVLLKSYKRHGSGAVDGVAVDDGVRDIRKWDGVLAKTLDAVGERDFRVEVGQDGPDDGLGKDVEEICKMARDVAFAGDDMEDDQVLQQVRQVESKANRLEEAVAHMTQLCFGSQTGDNN